MAKITKLEKIPSADILMQKKKIRIVEEMNEFSMFQYFDKQGCGAQILSSTPRNAQICTTQAALQPIRNTQHGLLKVGNLPFFEKKNYPRGQFESENTLTKKGSFIPPAERVEKFWKHMMRLKDEINMQTKKQKQFFDREHYWATEYFPQESCHGTLKGGKIMKSLERLCRKMEQ